MKPKASFENRFLSSLRCIIPSASRDCSTYQFRYASLSELEFNDKNTSSGRFQDWPLSFITSYLQGNFFIEKNTP
jgi:hypothetical protein